MLFNIKNAENMHKGLAISVKGDNTKWFEVSEAFAEIGCSSEVVTRIRERFKETGVYQGFLNNEKANTFNVIMLLLMLRLADTQLQIAPTPSPEYAQFAEDINLKPFSENHGIVIIHILDL